MALKSPLRDKSPQAISVCGKLLRKGQSMTVAETAIGPIERKKEANGLIKIRSSNEKGKVVITCTLK